LKSIWSSARSDPRARPCVRVDGQDVPVVIRRFAQAKGYRLRYDVSRGVLRLSMPARGPERAALDWARSQTGWVASQLHVSPLTVRLMPGVAVPVEGVERMISWDPARTRRVELGPETLYAGGAEEEAVPGRVLRWLRAHALTTLRNETLEMASRAGLQVASVAIGDPRSRWGSCASGGAIRYSWRLILAPPEVRVATVAHEVAHLLHMDHSAAFHAAHRRLLDADPRPARAWLRAHGAGLYRFTA